MNRTADWLPLSRRAEYDFLCEFVAQVGTYIPLTTLALSAVPSLRVHSNGRRIERGYHVPPSHQYHVVALLSIDQHYKVRSCSTRRNMLNPNGLLF